MTKRCFGDCHFFANFRNVWLILMSQYLSNLSDAIFKALSRVPSAQPSQVAGYWANRDFWLAEFHHLLDAIEGYDSRLQRMMHAQDTYIQKFGGDFNRDEFGTPRQQVRDTTNSASRRSAASNARTALKAMADRALDLRIAAQPDYDSFVHALRISSRHSDLKKTPDKA